MGRLNRYVTAATITLLTCSVVPLQASAETLQEAIQFLIETNPDIRSSAYLRRSRDEQVSQAKADYFPKVDFMAGTGLRRVTEPVDTDLNPTEYRLSLRQNLFTGFGTKYNVRRTKHADNSGAYRVQASTSNTALEGTRAYLDVLNKQQLIDLAETNLKNHLRIRDQIKLRSDSGLSRRAEMDQIDGRVSLARSSLVSTTANLVDAETNYFAVIGHVPQDLSRPEPPEASITKSMDEAQRLAVVNHPILKAIEEDLSAREAQAGIARSEYYPVIDLELDRYWGNEDVTLLDLKEEDLIIMLRLRYNLFHGLRDRARIRETKYLVDDAREARNDTARQVLESIRLSWTSYESQVNRYNDLKNRVKSTESTVLAYKKQWDIGKRTLLDLLDSEAEFINASRDLIDSQFVTEYAMYRLLNGIGRLIPTLGLAFPEESQIKHFKDEDEDEEKKDKS